MAKANWCTRKDEELVLDRLLHGGNVCDRCKRNCTTMGGRLIVANESYSVNISDLRRLPKGVHHCVSCNKNSGKIVAEAIGWNCKAYHVIMCNTCKKKWLKKL